MTGSGSGTFSNPILPGDFSDPDVIRSGDDYWMITSTFEYSPGMAVLHSYDLVTWRYAGHCVEDLTVLSPEYASDRMGRDGRGIFAGSIREHRGRFVVYFATLDEGTFMTSAVHPEGPWEPPVLIWDAKYWDDPCPLFDDDGRAWLVASRPGDPARTAPDDEGWMTYLLPMSPDGRSVDAAAMTVLDPTWSSEGNKLYTIDGRYYLLHNESRGPGHRVAVIMRADVLQGPWEKRVLVRGSGTDRDREPNQGALVETPAGDWWFVTHHGRMGYPEGRPVSVLPVRWEDGWPTAGLPDPPEEGGVMTWQAPLPVPGAPGSRLVADDDFTSGRLDPQWEWRYQPPAGAWSIGFGGLRLTALPPLRPGDARTARAALTQRSLRGPGRMSVQVDLAGSADGMAILLGHRGGHFSGIQVFQDAKRRYVQVIAGDPGQLPSAQCSTPLDPSISKLELCSDTDRWGFVSYGFSIAGQLHPLGESFPVSMLEYRGDRVLLQCTTSKGYGAYAILQKFSIDSLTQTADG